MPFKIIRNDITKTKADAIVNTANPNPVVGSGVDTSIYEAAGFDALLAEREKIGRIDVGDVVATSAFNLDAKFILHAVSPAWKGGANGEKIILAALYKKCLEIAAANECKSIAFPLLASGNYRFPKDVSIQIAVKEFRDFLLANDMEIILVVYDNDSVRAGENIFPQVEKFISDNYVEASKSSRHSEAKRYFYGFSSSLSKSTTLLSGVLGEAVIEDAKKKRKKSGFAKSGLDDRIKKAGKPFDEYLRSMMNKKQLTSVDICRRGNIDRRYFSKLISNTVTPSKQKLLSLAVALELNIDETTDFLKYMGYALSDNDITDLIFMFYIQNKNYDIYEINTVLFQHDQKLLFGEE